MLPSLVEVAVRRSRLGLTQKRLAELEAGRISERTILDQILSGKRPEELSSLRVEEVVEPASPQVDEDAPLSLVSHLLRHYQAVLVARKGELVGIITKADLLKMIA